MDNDSTNMMNVMDGFMNESNSAPKQLSYEEMVRMEKQNTRMVSKFAAEKLEVDSKKHWDLFYKRNETRFFRDRHWTTREFQELLGVAGCVGRQALLEVGCGVGNLIFPLIEDDFDMFVYACDLSPRAVSLVLANPRYDERRMRAFEADITTDAWQAEVPPASVDIVTLVFVLSAIAPTMFGGVLRRLASRLRPGGCVLFRDYGLHDMAQIRFKPGHKIADNCYVRQDGTRSYFFSTELLGQIFVDAGFIVVSNVYVHRRTINRKEGVDVPRVFVQGKFQKPAS